MMQTIFPHVFSAVDYNAISQVIHSLTEQSLCHVPNVTVCRFEVAGFFFPTNFSFGVPKIVDNYRISST